MTEGHRQFELGEFLVEVWKATEGPAPWDSAQWIVYASDVAITFHGEIYLATYYGSVVDYKNGKESDPKSVATCVLEELLSAARDPGEFLRTIGPEPSREQLRIVLDLLDCAERWRNGLLDLGNLNEDEIAEALREVK